MESKELLEKAKAAKSAEELMAIAKENGVELTEEEAAAYFAQLNKSGELSDDELDAVAGGGCHKKDGRLVVTIGYGCDQFTCKMCGQQYTEDHKHRSTSNGCGGGGTVVHPHCYYCTYMTHEGGLWLCNNPANMK